MRIADAGVVRVVSFAATGCAAIVSGVNQPISVETRLDGKPLAGARCRLTSNKGTWFVTTPCSVTVHRGFQDLDVECTKEGAPTGVASFASSTKPMAFGNILFGGAIGVGVDVGTGAACDYPALLSIDMGKSTVRASDGERARQALDAGLSPDGAIRSRKPRAVPIGIASGAPEFVPPVAPARNEVPVADSPPLRFKAYAEKLARTRPCHPQPIAASSAIGPESETCTIACVAGEPMVARCAADECRELR